MRLAATYDADQNHVLYERPGMKSDAGQVCMIALSQALDNAQ